MGKKTQKDIKFRTRGQCCKTVLKFWPVIADGRGLPHDRSPVHYVYWKIHLRVFFESGIVISAVHCMLLKAILERCSKFMI